MGSGRVLVPMPDTLERVGRVHDVGHQPHLDEDQQHQKGGPNDMENTSACSTYSAAKALLARVAASGTAFHSEPSKFHDCPDAP